MLQQIPANLDDFEADIRDQVEMELRSQYQHETAEKVKHATRVAAAKAATHARSQYASVGNYGSIADEVSAREVAETTLVEVSAEADRALRTIAEVTEVSGRFPAVFRPFFD